MNRKPWRWIGFDFSMRLTWGWPPRVQFAFGRVNQIIGGTALKTTNADNACRFN
jgi:hypothetical protein